MNYEKKHKDSVTVALRLLKEGKISLEDAEEMFPELRESEDKKVRISLIEFVKHYGDSFYGQVAKMSAIHWLERQGDSNPVGSSAQDLAMIENLIPLIDVKEYPNYVQWLISLRNRCFPEYGWKPTAQQLYILNWVTSLLNDGMVEKNAKETLESLYEDLKKIAK